MLYTIAHFLRDKMPWLWDLVDIINSIIFSFRYGDKLIAVEKNVFETYNKEYKIARLRDVDTDKLVKFFAAQPKEAYTFFKPHRFDKASIKKLQRNKAFLAYILLDVDSYSTRSGQAGSPTEIVAYCFNRSFFYGKGFRGRMVGIDYRGKGLGTLMNKILNEVGFGIGMHLYETVSKDNVASYRSAISASNFKVIEELPHNELYLEILPE